uniref:Uncharacterized protein n=1 Tax=Anguilla anguilla TaxID=7936 RepID=A0A0E9UB87_ANGAN
MWSSLTFSHHYFVSVPSESAAVYLCQLGIESTPQMQ